MLNLFKKALAKTRELVSAAFRANVPAEVLEELSDRLILADVGPAVSGEIIENLRKAGHKDTQALRTHLRDELLARVRMDGSAPRFASGSSVWFVLGSNGAGKTTTCAKLAHLYRREGKTVALVAADTFRAAAIDQLAVWAGRAGVPVFKMHEGASPAAVLFDALSDKKISASDLIIVDTAGRLHTKAPLLDELAKMRRIAEKQMPGALTESLLVLDGTTGQNALAQARTFHESIGLTGLIVTKLDATGKAGFLAATVSQLKLPVKFAGLGEGLDDLIPFDAGSYVDAMIGCDASPAEAEAAN